jgi:phage repressor protein C with HTH and peptisase S24 domain
MKIVLKELGGRIKHLRGTLTLDEFGNLVGVSRSMVSKYENGDAWPKPETLSNIVEYGKVSYEWLLTGKTLPESPPMVSDSKIAYLRPRTSPEDTLPPGYARASVYYLAGGGVPQELTEYDPISSICLPEQYLKPSIVPIKISGRSMEPVIYNNAFVGVATEEKRVISGEIYAVWLPYEGAVVKRLYMASDKVILKSDNPSFPDIEIPKSEIEGDHFILGRVKWVLQEF